MIKTISLRYPVRLENHIQNILQLCTGSPSRNEAIVYAILITSSLLNQIDYKDYIINKKFIDQAYRTGLKKQFKINLDRLHNGIRPL